MKRKKEEEILRSTLAVLKRVGTRFQEFSYEADVALYSTQDINAYGRALKKRAELIVGLPELLPKFLSQVNCSVCGSEIRTKILYFYYCAMKALNSEDGLIELDALFCCNEELNELEKLIVELQDSISI